MGIPSYAYLKLKITGPTGIITVQAKMQRALDCEQSSNELATTMVTMAELRELSLWIPMAPLSLEMRLTSSVFKTDEDARAMQIDAGNLAKTV
jgi:hypothetical protein